MKKVIYIGAVLLGLVACGQSYEEQMELTRAERIRLAKEDSAALKIGTLPTMDCLPLFVAKERRLFDTLGVDIRLKCFDCQIDCDNALRKGRVEGNVTDLVRAEWMKGRGAELRYATATDLSWQFVTNRKSRINEFKQLKDKMLAMTRFSATHLMAEQVLDSAKLKEGDAFMVQINDPNIRLKMLQNNELDAMFLPEPQATTARIWKNPVLMDTRNKDWRFGVIAFREKVLSDKNRQRQYQAFLKGYNAAVDSINKYGINGYADLIKKYMKVDDETVRQLPRQKYVHASSPRDADVERARKWVK